MSVEKEIHKINKRSLSRAIADNNLNPNQALKVTE